MRSISYYLLIMCLFCCGAFAACGDEHEFAFDGSVDAGDAGADGDTDADTDSDTDQDAGE